MNISELSLKRPILATVMSMTLVLFGVIGFNFLGLLNTAKYIVATSVEPPVNQATILDVKTAQSSYELTGYQLINLKFAAKMSEIELKRLMYQLGN